MPRTKTRLRAEATRATINAFHFFKNHIATVVLAVAFFTHFFLPIKEPAVVNAKELRSIAEENIAGYNAQLAQLAIDLKNGVLQPGPFNQEVTCLEQLALEEGQNLKTLDASYIEVREAHRVFGFPSRHKFIWALGIGVIISVLTIRFLGKVEQIRFLTQDAPEVRNERWADYLFAIVSGTTGGYFFAWIFYPEPDLPYGYYMMILVTLGLLSSLAGYFMSRAYVTKSQKIALLQDMLKTKMKLNQKTA